jgi:hypothetical protein
MVMVTCTALAPVWLNFTVPTTVPCEMPVRLPFIRSTVIEFAAATGGESKNSPARAIGVSCVHFLSESSF